jgi:hypothetical protein
MLVRPATKTDFPGVASAAVAAYIDDPQDAYLYPKRADYAANYLKVESCIIKHSLDDPTAFSIVAVLEPGDEGWNGAPEITALCIGIAKLQAARPTTEAWWYLVSGFFGQSHQWNAFKVQLGRDVRTLMSTKGIKVRFLSLVVVDSIRDLVNPMVDSSHAKAMARMCSSEASQRWNQDGYKKPDTSLWIPSTKGRGIDGLLLHWVGGLE